MEMVDSATGEEASTTDALLPPLKKKLCKGSQSVPQLFSFSTPSSARRREEEEKEEEKEEEEEASPWTGDKFRGQIS